MEHYFSALERQFSNCWYKKALCNYEGESLTFGQLAMQIETLHIIFRNSGIRKGDRIVICARNSANWAVAFLAVNTYEAVAVPLLADFTPESITNLINHSKGRILFTDPEIWEKLQCTSLPDLEGVVSCRDFTLLHSSSNRIESAFATVDSDFEALHPLVFTVADVCYPKDNYRDLAVINYTSGTTSAPKGVMLKYESFCATIDYGTRGVKCTSNDTVVSMLPMGHIYGMVFEFLYPLCNGATVYFLGKTPSPSRLLKAMKEIKPYMVCTVPLVMEKIYHSSIKPALERRPASILKHIPLARKVVYRKVREKLLEAFGGNVKTFIMGGAALNPEVEKCFRRIGLPYTVGYGMTEAAPILAYASPESYMPGSCGRAVDCATVRIDSEDPYRIPGEIQAKGTNICMGYYNNEEATANAFTEDGFLRTGDLGIIDRKGNIFIKGRSKSMILTSNGQNIYPEEVEAVVNSQEFVIESLVVSRASKLISLVYIDMEAVRKHLGEARPQELLESIRRRSNRLLPSYSQIYRMELVDVPFEKTPKMSIKRFLYK